MEPITIDQDLTFEVRPVRILEEFERVLRNKTLKYVKVLWLQQTEREVTWELEPHIRDKYPELFNTGGGTSGSGHLTHNLCSAVEVNPEGDMHGRPGSSNITIFTTRNSHILSFNTMC